ncbi:hypothetical protein M0R45_000960 [Rubus argutus]|uniref:Uncharacterized protein n=1 Tax=Rubus argutus TaxID=59490 RepID=A0AAW1VRX2_RUBAR
MRGLWELKLFRKPIIMPAPKGGRRERNPKPRDNSGRHGPYNRSAQEGSRRTRRVGGRMAALEVMAAAGPVESQRVPMPCPLRGLHPRARNAT